MRSCNRVFIYFLSIFVAVATLSLGSYFQKSLINAPITVMGFLIPAIYGTLVGFLGGFFICRTINLIYKLKNKNKEIEQEKVRAIEHELKFKKLFESAHDAILILKKGKVVDCNFKACEIYKCKEDALEGENPLHFAPQYQPDGKNSVEGSNRLLALAEHGMSQSFEWTQQRGDGAGFAANVSLNFLQLQDEIYVQAIIRDITDKKLNQ